MSATTTITNINSNEKKELDTKFKVSSVDVCKELNRIPYAEIVVDDGDVAKQVFELANKAFFQPGQEIQIKMRYEGQSESESTVFSGIVVGQAIRRQGTKLQLVVSLKDKAFKMTLCRNSKVHRDLRDSDIITELWEAHLVDANSVAVDKTEPVHKELLQYYSTDWDFLMLRAQAQGLLVSVDDGILSARKNVSESKQHHRIEFGLTTSEDSTTTPKNSNLKKYDSAVTPLNFTMALDCTEQPTALKGYTWDIDDQALIASETAEETPQKASKPSAKDLAEALGNGETVLVNSAALKQEELQAWTNATAARIRLALRRGSVTVKGKGSIKPFDLLELVNFGSQFDGEALVSAVRHRVTPKGGWVTDIQFGLSAEDFAAKPGVADYPAAGLLPPVNGLRIGVVADSKEDPDNQLRVKVTLPGTGDKKKLLDKGDTLWARLATPDAGEGRGFFFRPEVGDEVVLGFFNNDPRQAVVIGSLYSSKKPPPDEWNPSDDKDKPSCDRDNPLDDKNNYRGIATKSGTKIEFFDSDNDSVSGKLLIQTKKKQTILLDDSEEGRIDISDSHRNKLVMDANGISISSDTNLNLEAKGNVTICGENVDIQ